MRYKLFDAETGEPCGYSDDIFAAVTTALMIEGRRAIRVAIKDEHTGVVL